MNKTRMILTLLLGCFLGSNALAAQGCADDLVSTLHFDLSGMISFAPYGAERKEMEVLLVNDFGGSGEEEGAHGAHSLGMTPIRHAPLLELNCQNLDPSLRPLCYTWSVAEGSDNADIRAVALDGGYRITLKVTSPEAGTAQELPKGVVPMGSLDEGYPAIAYLNPDALLPDKARDFALASLRLTGGRFKEITQSGGPVSFKRSLLGHVHHEGDVAQTVSWETKFCGDSEVEITLTPYPRPEEVEEDVERLTLVLRTRDCANEPPGSCQRNSIRLGLSNEPDAFEYCRRNPRTQLRPLRHFSRYYELAAWDSLIPSGWKPPLPFSPHTAKQCSLSSKAKDSGRRVNCMMTKFEGIGLIQ